MCWEMMKTLRGMNILECPKDGYIPTYMRMNLTDQLHDVFGFRPDTEIRPLSKMKKLKTDSKAKIVLPFRPIKNEIIYEKVV